MSTFITMISSTAKYALRAVVFLATKKEGVFTRSEIASSTMVPKDYLLKVLNELDASEIVKSKRGPGGGYRLAVPANKLTVLDVVLAVDDIPRISECPLGIKKHKELCPLHKLLDRASAEVERVFRKTKISQLLSEEPADMSCRFPASKKEK